MPPFSWIGRLIAGIWGFSRRSWVDTGVGLRPRSGASALVLFLFLLFFLVGLILLLLGVGLEDADVWLDAQTGWLDLVGTLLFRAFSGMLLLICVLAVIGGVVDRANPDRPGIGCMIGALIVGYFAWFGLTG